MANLPATTYTPNGVARAPGYYDPNNPYDTGWSGQRNAELNGGSKTTYGNWNYDTGTPYGASLDENTGLYGLAGSPGGGGGGGGGALGSFGPEYDQMMQDLKAQSVADKASRDAAIKRSFINFGLGNFDLSKAAATTGIGDLASILDPQTLELAKNNQFSVQQRINRGLADQQQSNRVQLRQRGGVRSGESGYLAQKSQTAYDTDVYDSSQKLLDYIAGAQQGFAQAERERQMQAWQAALAAAARGGYGGYGYGGGGGGGAAAPAAAPSTYTNPLTGNTWTQVGGQGGEWTRWPGRAS